MRKPHDWKPDLKRSARGRRVSVCQRCEVLREDTSCRGRHVRYLLDGKWFIRQSRCEVKA